MRVVADLGSLLVAEDRLYRRVDVQDPRLAEDRLHAGEQFIGKPLGGSNLWHPLHRIAHDILAHSGAHPEDARVDGVTADGVEVCVTPVASEDGHEGCPKDIDDFAATVAGVGQRAVLEETLPALACVKELGKKDELALAGDRCVWVEFRIETPPGVSTGQLGEGSERVNIHSPCG